MYLDTALDYSEFIVVVLLILPVDSNRADSVALDVFR
jgi:hypothetical protein